MREDSQFIKGQYETILADIKKLGYKVRHRKLKGGVGGLYDPDTTNITIDSVSRGTRDGCYILCHEFHGHCVQHRQGLFPLFFAATIDDPYSDILMEQVVLAEQDAARRGVLALKSYGIMDYKADELDSTKIPGLMVFWRKHYFDA